MKKFFTVAPNGVIKGGDAWYDADPVSGIITYHAEVKVKIVFFTKTETFDGSYTVDPSLLLPTSMDEVGEKQKIGNVEFDVTATDGKQSQVSVTVLDKNMSGVGVVLLNNPIELQSLQANATVMGMNLVLDLEPVV